MSLAILSNETQAALTIDAAKNSPAVYAPFAEKVAFAVVASAASSPVGTTVGIQGSIDGVNYATLTGLVTVTGNGTFFVELGERLCSYIWYRLVYARTSGSYVSTATALTKGQPL